MAIKVKITNPGKVYFPDDAYTKKDLFDYYESMADYIFPYLEGKPQSLHRFPDGIYGEKFYQKNVEHMPPEWVNTKPVWSESNNKFVQYIVPDNKETILFMANLGCIEMNPWNSKYKSMEMPDYAVIDLDPEEIGFEAVIETAQAVKSVLDAINTVGYVKTSGATGLHIHIPTNAKYTYDQVKNFTHILVSKVHQMLPEITSLERMPKKRQGKVYLDYLQNAKGQTMASPYSVRPRKGATVSTPLEWSEVKKGLDPAKFTIKNINKRVDSLGDIFKPVLGRGVDIENILKSFDNSQNN